ncbi:MAG: carbon starvation protein A [Muribaculaceae bacterium]|nr:carbon starvation protein A [Muribaculaceae bacterium]
MHALLLGLAVLIGGYFLYGTFIEKIIGVDSKKVTPAYEKQDGVDFIPMPTWKVFLIQFLNIAGLGPIFGAIMGIMFGPAAFLWIALGTIFAGAVHDMTSAFISLRSGGASLPEIIGDQLGMKIRNTMRIFSLILMILVAAVFVVTPADLLAGMTPDYLDKTFWIVAIFAYYMLATLLPIDKIIGNFYPIFGFALLFMAAGILGVLIFGDIEIPAGLESGFFNRYPEETRDLHPIFPMMFVSIACGAISGFHATQSPMMARCLKNEKLAKPIFYGAMVAEGIVAMIWAAAAIAFTGGYEYLSDYMSQGNTAGSLVKDISMSWLGTMGGILALLGVICAPITTGDTALRSARLIASDFLKFSQNKLMKRVWLSIPIFLLTMGVMLIDFNVLWRYFAWCNQTLAVFTLWGVTVWLVRRGKNYLITLLPALFMTAVCVSYILFAPKPEGIGLPMEVALGIGLAAAAALLIIFIKTSVKSKYEYTGINSRAGE